MPGVGSRITEAVFCTHTTPTLSGCLLQLMLGEDFALWIYVFLPVPVTLKEKVPNHHGVGAPSKDRLRQST